MIELYAGQQARERILEHGFKAELFTSFLGASGGPKWFCLYELDKYVFGEFFKDREEELNLIGSSAGAFRAACFAQQDPIAALDRFAKSYSETEYSKKATPQEITAKARILLEDVFSTHGAAEIIDNPTFKAHFVVAKSNGWVQYENKLVQAMGLAKSYLGNRIDRKHLKRQYERFVFQSPSSQLKLHDPDGIPTQHLPLSQDNIMPALLASGSIPMVMMGIPNIPGAPAGMYRDGGVIDYHFDLGIESDGLTLYPHFHANPKPGWFDKNSKRQARSEHYDKTVIVCPSQAFVSALPYGKIPDRNDFVNMEVNARKKYWKTVLAETERTAEAFDKALNGGRIEEMLQPLPF